MDNLSLILKVKRLMTQKKIYLNDSGHPIHYMVEKVTVTRCKVKFILIVEKFSILKLLIGDKFFETFKYIMISILQQQKKKVFNDQAFRGELY